MARRSGQLGYEEVKGGWYHVRFRMDVPGQENRLYLSRPICPVSGPGRLTKPERLRKRKEIIAASGADTEEHFKKVEAVNYGTTFRKQAEQWLKHVQMRNRKPIAPATATSWESCLDVWLNPHLGGMPLSSINNPEVKQLVAKMVVAGLSAKSVNNYVQVVKMVVASAINENGEELYPRKWNHEFLDLPEVKNQKQPAFTCEVMNGIIDRSKGQLQILYTLAGAAGLRIGEALGIEIGRHISDDCSTLEIRQKVWNGQVQSFLKTENGLRDVDLHSSVAVLLKAFIGDRKSGLLFCTRNGGPLSLSNILRRNLHRILKELGQQKTGAHAFRRFRVTWLRKNRTPGDLERFWLGHANKTVTDDYSMLKEDVTFRKEVAEKVGIGFELPIQDAVVAPNAPKEVDQTSAESVT